MNKSSYPKTILQFDRETGYDTYIPTESDYLPGSDHQDRRFSVASEVLPQEFRHRRDSSGTDSTQSAYSTGNNGVLSPTGSLSTAPYRSTMRASPSDLTNLQASISYFSISETDDPAVQQSLVSPTRSHYSSPTQSNVPSLVSPTSSHASSSLRSPLLLSARPPQLSRRPSDLVVPQLPYTCAFQDTNPGCMVLLPPGDASDRGPLYHIEVRPNCFMPSSYITTVLRGNRDFVGRFESVHSVCVIGHHH